MEQKNNVLELLLQAEVPQPRETKVRVTRLSELCGGDVIFTLRQLGYSRLAEIRELSEKGDFDVHVVLAGVTVPNLRDKELMGKYQAVTPAELIKKLLEPGEISELANAIVRLSGYVRGTVEELEKNAQTPSGA